VRAAGRRARRGLIKGGCHGGIRPHRRGRKVPGSGILVRVVRQRPVGPAPLCPRRALVYHRAEQVWVNAMVSVPRATRPRPSAPCRAPTGIPSSRQAATTGARASLDEAAATSSARRASDPASAARCENASPNAPSGAGRCGRVALAPGIELGATHALNGDKIITIPTARGSSMVELDWSLEMGGGLGSLAVSVRSLGAVPLVG
jgi:hypothetical protein